MVDIPAPLEYIIASANKGDAESAFRLGLIYEKGEFVKSNDKEAAKWYLKAAEKGHAWAQLAMGHLCAIGFGTPRSETKAREWFSKATSKTDDMDVIAQVAELYYHGYGEGYSWFWADGAEAAGLAKIASSKGNAEENTMTNQHPSDDLSAKRLQIYRVTSKIFILLQIYHRMWHRL